MFPATFWNIFVVGYLLTGCGLVYFTLPSIVEEFPDKARREWLGLFLCSMLMVHVWPICIAYNGDRHG